LPILGPLDKRNLEDALARLRDALREEPHAVASN
jgi:hypothetical protein